MRLFIIRNYLNVFLVEESSFKENCYRISHYNFSPTNYNIQKHYFNNTIKNNESLYKLNIDDMGNMIFTYDYSEQNKRSEVSTQTFVFNNSNRKWTLPIICLELAQLFLILNLIQLLKMIFLNIVTA